MDKNRQGREIRDFEIRGGGLVGRHRKRGADHQDGYVWAGRAGPRIFLTSKETAHSGIVHNACPCQNVRLDKHLFLEIKFSYKFSYQDSFHVQHSV